VSEQEKDLYTIAEAAEAWGISIQAVYKRFNKLKQQGLTSLKDGKPCISRDMLESFKPVIKPGLNQVEQPSLILNREVESLTTSLNALKAELLEEKGRAAALQATIDAQKAHIDSLQAALDKTQTALNQEQTLHLATMQQRLPGPRKGFMEWLRGGKKEGQNGR
jgi:DNA-binding transcriptional regulator GbsR (MarR family)